MLFATFGNIVAQGNANVGANTAALVAASDVSQTISQVAVNSSSISNVLAVSGSAIFVLV